MKFITILISIKILSYEKMTSSTHLVECKNTNETTRHSTNSSLVDTNNTSLTIIEAFEQSSRNRKCYLSLLPVLGPLSMIRDYIKDSKLYIMGGIYKYNSSLQESPDIYCFDYSSNTWSVVGVIEDPFYSSVSVLINGFPSIIGGSGQYKGTLRTVYRYNPYNRLVEKVTSMSQRRSSHGASSLSKGTFVFANGGSYLHDIGMITSNTCEYYKSETNIWTNGPLMYYHRENHVSIALEDFGSIFCIGGSNRDNNSLYTCEYFDIYSDRWVLSSNLNSRRISSSGVSLDNVLYIIGGTRDPSKEMAPIERCDLRDPNGWINISGTRISSSGSSSLSSQYRNRYGHKCVTKNGKILVVGGHVDTYIVNSSICFCPVSNTWYSSPISIPTYMTGFGALLTE